VPNDGVDRDEPRVARHLVRVHVLRRAHVDALTAALMPAHPKPPPREKSRTPMKRGKPIARGDSQLKRTRMNGRSEKREALYAGESDDCGPCPTCKGCGWTAHHQHDGRELPIDCHACKGTGREGRRAFNARILSERPDCQACPRIRMTGGLGVQPPTCAGRSCDVHEVLARSAGGSIIDPANVLAVCRAGHDWIGQHPREALALGLRRSRYAGRNLA
jgi:hypothetical protein